MYVFYHTPIKKYHCKYLWKITNPFNNLSISDDFNPSTTDFQGCFKFQMPQIFRGLSKSKHTWFSYFRGVSDFKCHYYSLGVNKKPHSELVGFENIFQTPLNLRFSKSKCHLTYGLMAFGFWKPQKIHLIYIFQNPLVVGFLLIYNLLFNFLSTLYFVST